VVFVHADAMQFGVRHFRREALPDGYRQILRRRNAGQEFGDFFVQKSMVHGVEDLAMHGFLKLLEVNHEAGAGIDLSLDRDFEDVVVPVSVGVIALAEDAPVLLRGELGIVVIVRGGEFSFAGEIEQRTSFQCDVTGCSPS